MVDFPRIKKKAIAFLKSEEGIITKESLVKIGVSIGITVALLPSDVEARGLITVGGDLPEIRHTNSMDLDIENNIATGSHANMVEEKVCIFAASRADKNPHYLFCHMELR